MTTEIEGEVECPMCHHRFGKIDKTKEDMRRDVINKLILSLELMRNR
jgi:hypothetical protein